MLPTTEIHILCLEQWFLSCISNGWDETCPYCRNVWEKDNESIPEGLDFDMEELVDDEEELDWNLHIVPQLNAFLELIRGNNLDDFSKQGSTNSLFQIFVIKIFRTASSSAAADRPRGVD